jgi:hypothetical protein
MAAFVAAVRAADATIHSETYHAEHPLQGSA